MRCCAPGRSHGAVHRVIGVARRDGRRRDARQGVGAIEVQEVEVIVVFLRRRGQRIHGLDGEPVTQAQPRETALQRIAGEQREAVRIGELRPQAAEPHSSLAVVYDQLGRKDDAARERTAAQQLGQGSEEE